MADNDKFADEIMSDDELDGVAGGNAKQCEADSRFLNSLNGSTDRYGEQRIAWSAGSLSSEIEKGWATVGIKADVCFGLGGFGYNNKYYLNGQQITVEQARQHAMNVTGHHMTESEWNW